MKAVINGVCYDTENSKFLYEETSVIPGSINREVYVTRDGRFFFVDVEKTLTIPSEEEECNIRKEYPTV